MPDEKDKQRPKRSAPISYRPPASLREEFLARVDKSGLTTSAFITRSIFDAAPSRQARRPALEEKLLAKLLHEATKIHGDLQQLQAGSDDDEIKAKLDETRDELTVIRAALLKAMGRNP